MGLMGLNFFRNDKDRLFNKSYNQICPALTKTFDYNKYSHIFTCYNFFISEINLKIA